MVLDRGDPPRELMVQFHLVDGVVTLSDAYGGLDCSDMSLHLKSDTSAHSTN